MPEALHELPVEDNSTLARVPAVRTFERSGEDSTSHLQLVEAGEGTMGVSGAAQAIRRRVAEWVLDSSALASPTLKSTFKHTIIPRSMTLSIASLGAALPGPPAKCPPRLFGQLLTTIGAETVEDGVSHPGEALATKIVSSGEASSLVDATIASSSSVAASIVQLLGRLRPLELPSRTALIKHALNSEDIQLRDAAIQAIELWEDESMIPLLASHREPVGWLNDYVIEVLEDLKG